MKLALRASKDSDEPFLRKMLYEAVFWRQSDNKPSFEEGLSYPNVRNAFEDWGKRESDIAVIATIDSIPVGAAWYRFWTESNNTRGYINENTPVLAIGVQSEFRHQGIGQKMIGWLVEYASKHLIKEISLCVSKDNYAMKLYKQQGFEEYADNGDSIIMIRRI